MPTVEKVRGGRVTIRGIGRFDIGDVEDVSQSDADYLVNERGDFRVVDADTDGTEFSAEAEITVTADSSEDATETPEESNAPESDSDADTCQTVKGDGDVCGRALPCPYHSED